VIADALYAALFGGLAGLIGGVVLLVSTRAARARIRGKHAHR